MNWIGIMYSNYFSPNDNLRRTIIRITLKCNKDLKIISPLLKLNVSKDFIQIDDRWKKNCQSEILKFLRNKWNRTAMDWFIRNSVYAREFPSLFRRKLRNCIVLSFVCKDYFSITKQRISIYVVEYVSYPIIMIKCCMGDITLKWEVWQYKYDCKQYNQF